MSEIVRLKNIFYISFVILLMYLGKALFIPLTFSAFASFILYPVCKWLEIKKIPKVLSIAAGLFILFIPVVLFIFIVVKQLSLIKSQIPGLKEKLPATLSKFYYFISDKLGVPVEKFQAWLSTSIVKSFEFLPLFKGVLQLSGISTILIILIPVYTFLILYYRNNYVVFLMSLFPATDKDYIITILKDTVHTYFRFIKGMIMVYIIVGILNSLGLYLLGIPSPFFWGFLASILTIIPYIGIIIGTIIPISVAFTSHDSIWFPIAVIAIFTFVQILEAYLIFPLVVGKKLALNPLMVLLAVIAGGIVWGVSGMILFIPALGILKLISEKNPKLEPLSILLGQKIH